MHRKLIDYSFVAAQFLCMALIFLSIEPLESRPITYLGVGVIGLLGGIGIMVTAIWQMRRHITALPSPKQKATLLTTGIYAWIRHPMYTGILLAGLSWWFLWGDDKNLLLTWCLLILFEYKSQYEEKLLSTRFSSYTDYIRVTGKFLPKWF